MIYMVILEKGPKTLIFCDFYVKTDEKKSLPYIPFYTVYPSVLAVLHHQ